MSTQKTKLKTKIIKVKYWTCGFDHHNHKTKETAQSCIDRNIQTPKTKRLNAWTDEALAEILTKKRAGIPLHLIADEYSVSRKRVEQVLEVAAQREKKT